MSRLTQQLSTVSKSLMRISEQLTELAMQLDRGEPLAAAAKQPQKASKPTK
jgi:hypothetical protein